MSVMIMGLKLPKDRTIKVAIRGDDGIASVYLDEGKADYYSVIELPDHGDLIDKDALKEKAHKLPNGYNHGYFHKCVDELFDYTPVIIPAERSEDGET